MTQDTEPVKTLDYATPPRADPARPPGEEHFRSRVVFSIGLGLLAAGLGGSIGPNSGWWLATGFGGLLVGLSCPMRFHRPG